MELDLEKFRQHVANGLVRVQAHPTLPLSICNYAERVQYDKLWDDVTLQCRGLVMHGDTIVARPFRKFFNDTEHGASEIPWHLPCEITDKMDGSLLVHFCFEGQWITATRGSFASSQAAEGHAILEEHYGHVDKNPAWTYLFELISPANRIVVDYGGERDVVLLAVIDTETGEELPLRSHASPCFRHVRSLPPSADPKSLREIIRDDQEGYVVRFANGFRMKVKGERYLYLHKLFSGVSSRLIWEHLKSQKPFDELMAVIPDEAADWVRGERLRQWLAFERLCTRTCEAEEAVANLPSRKEKALTILCDFADVKSAAFAAIDGKETWDILWDQIYPELRRPVGMLAGC